MYTGSADVVVPGEAGGTCSARRAALCTSCAGTCSARRRGLERVGLIELHDDAFVAAQLHVPPYLLPFTIQVRRHHD